MQLLEHFYADDSHLLYLYVNSLVGPLQEIISKLLWNIIKRQPVKGKPWRMDSVQLRWKYKVL